MAYATRARVEAYCQNLLGSSDIFTTSTSPASYQVDAWLSSGCAIVESYLSGLRYDMPVADGTAIYDWLAQLNALYAAAQAELTRSNVVLSPGERTRGQVFEQMFWDGLRRLKDLDLSMAGATRSTSGKLYVGGISDADKDTVVSDTDRTTPRFSRGMFDTPGILQPAESTSSS